MSIKSMFVFVLLSILAFNANAQISAFFHPVPKPQSHQLDGKLKLKLVLDSNNLTMNAVRPIANVAAYSVPGNILSTGAGVSYQHLKWNVASQKWNCVWSVSGMGWVGAGLDPAQPANVMSYGIMLGLFNNLVMVGPALNGNKIVAEVAIGVSLNN